MRHHRKYHRTTQSYQKAERAGKLAEILIYCRFALTGWWLVKWRYQTGFGEIDLIMRRGGVLRFIEVKYRRHFRAEDSPVTNHQLHRLERAVRYAYAELCPQQDKSCLFEVIMVTKTGRIYHFPHHFDKTG